MTSPNVGKQFQQLPMFMIPHEIADMHGSDFDAPIRRS